MPVLKKTILSLIGGSLVLLGLMFILVPGPSLLFIVPGLIILSYEYTWAETWLRKCMKFMRKSAKWLDQKTRRRA